MFPARKPLAEDFERAEVTIDGMTKPVWRSGNGPGVVIMHEVPGITPRVARFARIVRDHGFTVFLPEMFGVVDKPVSGGYAISSMVHCCVSREFHVLATGGSSPITDWLRKLCRQVHEELGGPGVGALGMCMTGNFALSAHGRSLRCKLRCCPSPRCLSRSERPEAARSMPHPRSSRSSRDGCAKRA